MSDTDYEHFTRLKALRLKALRLKEKRNQQKISKAFQLSLSQVDIELRQRILAEVCDRATVKMVRKKLLKDVK